MKFSAITAAVGLLAAGVAVFASDAHGRDAPAAPAAATNAAVKKPPAKPTRAAARRPKEDVDPMAEVPAFSRDAVGWQLIEDAKTGARLGVPEKLVPHVGVTRSGTRWSTTQGQIQIETFRLGEASLSALFEQEKKSAHRQVTSSNLKPDSFVILGVQGLKNFLVRAEARGSEVRGVTVLYDQATEGTMGSVAIAVGNAFVGFPDPNAMPPPGLRRRVDYGSAIVLSAAGDLLAAAHSVDDCEAITVPPLGHAEPVAVDKATGLALIHLYGARNLAPATLAETNAPAGEVTLIGVADPLAQGGAAAVTTPARLSGQGIEPAPKLGFSGAAALDSRGRVVGMVDLSPAVIAGAGFGAPAAALVPVESIRAFLQAQHIAPAATGNGAINQSPSQSVVQSVLRVICVRK